jgi:TolB-like protein
MKTQRSATWLQSIPYLSWRHIASAGTVLLLSTLTLAQQQSGDLIVLLNNCGENRRRCTPERIAAFIKGGADPNAKDGAQGASVLQIAVRYGLGPEVLKALISGGAKVDPSMLLEGPAGSGTTAFGGVDGPERAEVLLRAGANVNAQDSSGMTPLMKAAAAEAFDDAAPFIKWLLKAGADASIKNRAGDTAVALAEKKLRGYESFVQEMLKRSQNSPNPPSRVLMEKRTTELTESVRALRDAMDPGSGSPAGPGGPPLPYIVKGACPSEGCGGIAVSGEGIADESTPVYVTEGDRTRVAFTLQRDEIFTGLGSNVHVRQPTVVIVTQAVEAQTDKASLRLKKGDIVYVLSPLGEGRYSVWYQGTEYRGVSKFWNEKEPSDEWWVAVRNRRGQSGWVFRGRIGSGVEPEAAASPTRDAQAATPAAEASAPRAKGPAVAVLPFGVSAVRTKWWGSLDVGEAVAHQITDNIANDALLRIVEFKTVSRAIHSLPSGGIDLDDPSAAVLHRLGESLGTHYVFIGRVLAFGPEGLLARVTLLGRLIDARTGEIIFSAKAEGVEPGEVRIGSNAIVKAQQTADAKLAEQLVSRARQLP